METLNVDLLNINEYIKRMNLLEFKSTMIKDSTTGKFHPDGLFSESIFGEVGMRERNTRLGYINLKANFIHPMIYVNLTRSKSFYSKILSGRAYATFNGKTKDFELVDQGAPGAKTGFSFFVRNFKDLKLKKSNSFVIMDKVKLINDYKDTTIINKFVISPAGIRDYREVDGRDAIADINKFYMRLLTLTKALPDKGSTESNLFDGIKYKIQITLNNIYMELFKMLNGKNAFFQGKYASRGIALSSRNVISATNISSKSPDDLSVMDPTDTAIPLYEILKSHQPKIIHFLKHHMFDMFSSSSTVPLIDKETNKLKYVDISGKVHSYFTTEAGMTKLLTNFKNNETRFDPVTVNAKDGKEYYMYMVRDTGVEILLVKDPQYYYDMLYSNEELHYKDIEPKRGLYMVNESKDVDRFHSKEILDWRKETGIEMIFENVLPFQIRPLLASYKALTDDEKKFSNEARVKMTGITNEKAIENILKWYNTTIRESLKLRPLTYAEMYTIAVALAVVNHDDHTIITRYPVNALGSTYPSRVKLASTQEMRTIALRDLGTGAHQDYAIIPNYVMLNTPFIDSIQIHPCRAKGLNSDYDGDTVSAHPVMSKDSIEECKKHLSSAGGIIDSDGSLALTTAGDYLLKLTIYNLSRDPND